MYSVKINNPLFYSYRFTEILRNEYRVSIYLPNSPTPPPPVSSVINILQECGAAVLKNEVRLNLNGCEFEQTSGDSREQGSLACCSPRGHKELDTTELLNNKTDALLVKAHDLEWVSLLVLFSSMTFEK